MELWSHIMKSMTKNKHLHLLNKLDTLISSYQTTTDRARGKMLRFRNPEFFNELSLEFPFIVKNTTQQQIKYILKHELLDHPKCICGHNNKWIASLIKYSEFCSVKCSTPSRIKRMNNTLGVSNTSQLQITKNKKIKTCLENYGVTNVSKSKVVRKKLSNRKKEYWGKIYDTLDKRYEAILYGDKVRLLTESNYREFKHLIDPENLRSRQWHLDHVFSIYDGYLNRVSIEVISHWTNLKIIQQKENSEKGRKSNCTLEELLQNFNQNKE